MDPNLTGAKSSSALLGVLEHPHYDTVRLLLDRDADINVPGGKLGSPLRSTSCAGELEAVILMLDYGAKVNTEIFPHGHILLQTSKWHRWEVLRLLIRNRAPLGAYR